MNNSHDNSCASLRRAAIHFAHLQRALRLIWAAAPRWTCGWAGVLLAQGLLPIATVGLTRPLVDSLAALAGAGGAWPRIQPALIYAALMIAALALGEALESLGEWVRAAQAELVQDHISALIHRQSVAVDLAFYETPEQHDRLHRARDDAGYRPLALLESMGGLARNGITLAAMAALLLPYGLLLPLALLASLAPSLYVLLGAGWREHRWWERTTADRRRTWYYETLLTSGESAAELRLFGLGAHFQAAYQQLRARLRGDRLGLMRSRSLARLAAGAAALAISGAALAWMLWRAALGQATLGDLALFYQAYSCGQALMRALLSDLGQIYSNSLFLGNLFEFLDLRPQVADPARPVAAPAGPREGIRFRSVAFRYPGCRRLALEDFDLWISAGQTVAIVGANGAGKSTLVKLLCRFYDPEAGSVELDGIDLREIALARLRRMVTVLFQSPVAYQDSIRQNIALGDLDAPDHPAQVADAARAAGADTVAAKLPQGYATQLGKTFAEGAELSGGEWQRVALARAFLRRAPIMLLDEPTSAMDSWSEADWFDRFRALARGRTAVIITHRLTIAMRADIIHVMDQGRIVESGSHAQLLTQGGRYARSWEAQMRMGQEVSL